MEELALDRIIESGFRACCEGCSENEIHDVLDLDYWPMDPEEVTRKLREIEK